MEVNKITEKIIGCAIEVHKALDPGLLESAYEECLAFELQNAGLSFEKQKPSMLQTKFQSNYFFYFCVINLKRK